MADSGKSSYRLAADSEVNVASILRFRGSQRGLTLASVDRLAGALGLVLVPSNTRKG
jgi:hypothetical protein